MKTTTVKTNAVENAVISAHGSAVQKAQEVKDKFAKTDIWFKLLGDYEFKRYGIVPILLLWNVCLAGIGVAVGALGSIPLTAMLVFPTMALLVLILAVAPMKLTLRVALFATILDLVVIGIGLLS